MVIRELEKRIEALEALIRQLIRPGTVTSVLDDQGRVRVKLHDSDGMISNPLQVLAAKTQKNKSYDLPDVGEQVLSLFLPTGLEQGFVLGAVNSDEDPPPVSDRNKTHYSWPDGSFIEYDRAAHRLSIHIEGDVVLSALNFKIGCPLKVDNDISATGSVIDGGGNTNHHSH
ncbi:MAG: phage baseplate assembly protein V [Desulfobacterales bacterium]|nr:phage baseplate assembly protein V [Desulfobacterales bacterium]